MAPPTTRTAYRALLRELPRRNNSRLLAIPPTPLHQRLREIFRSPTSSPTPSTSTSASTPNPEPNAESRNEGEMQQTRLEEATQLATYARAQRTYATLLERYNPGIFEVDQQERVRLTARRVGMEMPVEAEGSGKGEEGNGNGSGSGGDK